MAELCNTDDNSTIRRVLIDIERLTSMLSNELDENKSTNYSPQQSLSLSTTITSVTINDDNHRVIEHLRHRIIQLEHERNCSSYILSIIN